MTTTTHELKCDPLHFRDVMADRKRVEIRKHDRDFKVDDILHLNEYDRTPTDGVVGEQIGYSGRSVFRRITHVLPSDRFPDGLKPGYSALSLDHVE